MQLSNFSAWFVDWQRGWEECAVSLGAGSGGHTQGTPGMGDPSFALSGIPAWVGWSRVNAFNNSGLSLLLGSGLIFIIIIIPYAIKMIRRKLQE